MATFHKFDPATTVYYARVSTRGQTYKSQIEEFERAGALKENIFADIVSGAAKRLPQRDLAVRKVSRAGWCLVVTKLDRLGRNALVLLNTIKELEDEGAAFATLDGIIDTRNAFAGKLILGMLALVAEFEHGLISTRTKTGMAYRASKGAKFGAKKKLNETKLKAVKAALDARKKNGELRYTIEQIADKFDVSMTTLNNYFPGYRTRKLKKTRRGVKRAKRARK